MKRTTRYLLFFLLLSATGSARAQGPIGPAGAGVRRGEVIVEIKPGASIDVVNARNRTTTFRRIYGTNFYRVLTPKLKKENKFRKRLARDPDVLSATLNPVVSSPFTVFGRSLMGFPDGFAIPGHTSFEYGSQQQLVNGLNLAEVQARSTGKGVVVAVIDTGIDQSHQALAGRMWTDMRSNGEIPDDLMDNDGDGLVDDTHGWDFVDNDNDPTDVPDDPGSTVAGHGSFIAGLIALMAPDCRIMPLRVAPTSGETDSFTVAEAVKYAADHGANVINLSMGSSDVPDLLKDAIEDARRRGIIVVAAAGNENSEAPPQFPSSDSGVLAVAAVDSTGHKAMFSNFGSHVDVTAPGEHLISSFPGQSENDYAMWSGTSFAAPLASAEAALILSAFPGTPDAKKTIEDTAVSLDNLNPGFQSKLGRGRISPLAALQSLVIDAGTSGPLPLQAETSLTAVATGSAAYGKAEISVSGTIQEFEAEAYGLDVRQSFDLFVDGQKVVTGISTSLGSLKFELSTEPGHVQPPPSMLPVTIVKLIEFRDASGQVVLQGAFTKPTGTGGPPSSSIEKRTQLVSTGVLPQATGSAKAELESERQKLEIKAEGLTTGPYNVVVDGIDLGPTTSQFGYLGVEFSTDGSTGRLLPAALTPITNLLHVEVRDAANTIVLQGDFQPGGGDIGGDDNPGGGGGGGDGGGGGGGTPQPDTDKEISLTPTGVIANAEGRVRVRQSTDLEQLEIRADKLIGNVLYAVVVDGNSIGTFAASGSGSIDLEWRTDSGTPPPDSIRPVRNIRHVVIRTVSGLVVLTGDFPN
jgi:hypothetical protein